MLSNHTRFIMILISIILMIACEKSTNPPQISLPELTTIQVSGITNNTAISGGNITSDGGSEIKTKGVCWSTSSTPTITDISTNEGGGSGSFTSILTGLSADTSYYVCAYATNSISTGYGNIISFNTSSSNIQIDYLGQTPPGQTPVPFANNIFRSFALHSSPVFSQDGNEVYWSAFNMTLPGTYKLQLWYMIKQNDIWISPQVVSFFLNGIGDSPIFSPDGMKLFFLSGAPTPTNPNNTKENLWYSNKLATGWSEPILLSQEFDLYTFHWQVSIAENDNLYFSGYKTDLITGIERDIHLAQYVNGEYMNFINLGDSINTVEEMECTPCIAPDESYIIFSRGGDNEFSDLFISFKKTDGSWKKAKNMIGVNSSYHDINPVITPDGKYLIFTSEMDGGPYWVDLSVIDQYR